MGKRKSSKKPQAKIKLKLEKDFTCMQCNHEMSVQIRIDKNNQVGHLECKKCGVTFQSKTNYLSEPIDVYSDWVDAVQYVNKEDAGEKEGRRESRPAQYDDEDDLDD